MALATTYDAKDKIITDFLSRASTDEKKILLNRLIKEDMKLFFEAIFEERKFLEEESDISEAYLFESTECEDTSNKVWFNGEEVKDIESVRPENIGRVPKMAENNTYYFDAKKKLGNDKFDGFLGYINDSGDKPEVKNDSKE